MVTSQLPDSLLPFDRAAEYLCSRQSPSGGFCFYRTDDVDEPNLDDSYHAVRTLTLLGWEIPRRAELLEFIEGTAESGQPSHLYLLTLILRTLDPGYRPSPGQQARIRALAPTPPPGPDSPALGGWLHRTRTVARLKRLFTDFAEAEAVRRALLPLKRPGGGFGRRPNAWDTWLALDIAHACGGAIDLPDTRAFVDRLQTPPFGFSTVEGNVTSNLDTLFAGVRSCMLLGLPVKFPTVVYSFVLACQTGKGGFARAPDALPDIELTHRAVWTLLRLADCDSGDTEAIHGT